jgi:hypothetical protein
VFGPGFTVRPQVPDVARLGDEMAFYPYPHSGANGWIGYSYGRDRTIVERNGAVLVDEPELGAYVPSAPPEDSAYKLTMRAERPAPNTLSTKVEYVWTFRSGHVEGEEPVALPLSAVRFAPPVDNHNTARAGVPWVVPFEVQRQPNSAAGRPRTVTVDVSYDDGATWAKATVLRYGACGFVVLNHPQGAGFVSLRAASTDTAGNTVTQTVIRAYRIA